MQIDKYRILTMVAFDKDNYIELYRVSDILKLREFNNLTGHQGVDIIKNLPKTGIIYRMQLLPVTIARIRRYCEDGMLIIFNTSRKIHTSARPEDYLTPQEIFWLKTYAETSHEINPEKELNN